MRRNADQKVRKARAAGIFWCKCCELNHIKVSSKNQN